MALAGGRDEAVAAFARARDAGPGLYSTPNGVGLVYTPESSAHWPRNSPRVSHADSASRWREGVTADAGNAPSRNGYLCSRPGRGPAGAAADGTPEELRRHRHQVHRSPPDPAAQRADPQGVPGRPRPLRGVVAQAERR